MKYLIRVLGVIVIVGLAFAVPTMAGTDTWTRTGSMGTTQRDHTAVLLNDGSVLVVMVNQHIGPTAEIYYPSTGTFVATGSPTVAHGQGATATLLNDGRVLVAGGNWAHSSAEIFDPVTGSFSRISNMIAEHKYFSATLLKDGRVLIAGGWDSSNWSQTSAEIYDPVTDSFSPTGNMSVSRYQHKAVLLNDGRVLIVGGGQRTPPGPYSYRLNLAEVYDPAKGTFTPVGNINVWGLGRTATLLENGEVLVAGGSAELFDPLTDSFYSTGTLNMPRGAHTATLLNNGQVLIAGGYTNTGPGNNDTAEIYDPISGTFSITGSMNDPRQQHIAVKLPCGQVLVSGGYGGGTNLSSAELYGAITDSDGDGICDELDDCPDDPENDVDADGVCGDIDNCPLIANDNQHDFDGDGIGNECDADNDNDGMLDGSDNCQFDFNPDQADFDEDGIGDVCDSDLDGDDIIDADDECLNTPSGDVVDSTGCSVDQICPCVNSWKNHGAYVRCVSHTFEDFVVEGLISFEEKEDFVAIRSESTCGNK